MLRGFFKVQLTSLRARFSDSFIRSSAEVEQLIVYLNCTRGFRFWFQLHFRTKFLVCWAGFSCTSQFLSNNSKKTTTSFASNVALTRSCWAAGSIHRALRQLVFNSLKITGRGCLKWLWCRLQDCTELPMMTCCVSLGLLTAGTV